MTWSTQKHWNFSWSAVLWLFTRQGHWWSNFHHAVVQKVLQKEVKWSRLKSIFPNTVEMNVFWNKINSQGFLFWEKRFVHQLLRIDHLQKQRLKLCMCLVGNSSIHKSKCQQLLMWLPYNQHLWTTLYTVHRHDFQA